MSGNTEDHLASFLMYSLFVYPITNYIVSPSRKYPRWKAAVFAVAFLAVVAFLHLQYESMESDLNHYQRLSVQRGVSDIVVKKAYRVQSLELHPDKNRAATATDDFQKIKQAFDVLIDKDKRAVYNRLGDAGVAMMSRTVIDLHYIILQLVVYYVTSLIFAFVMTFSEPTGDAFVYSLFGLSVMLLLEMLLVVKEYPLPLWLFPQHTSHEVIAVVHRLFPAYMNGCRCIAGAFHVDHKQQREHALEVIAAGTKALTLRLANVAHTVDSLVRGSRDDVCREGVMAAHLADARKRFQATKEGRDGSFAAAMAKKVELISDPVALKKTAKKGSGVTFEVFRNLSAYLLARFALIKPNGTFVWK